MHYDAIIIGSGAGGSATAYKLVKAGKQVLLIEKGQKLPADGSTQDCQKVINKGVFKSREPWLDKRGKLFTPEEYFNLGGKTKWYGAALLRFDPSEFNAEPDFNCLGWPFAYEELKAYYAEAEKLFGVRTFPVEKDLKTINENLAQQQAGWESLPLPLALSQEILADNNETRHFDGFASTRGFKADAEESLLNKLNNLTNLKIITGHSVSHLLGASGNPYQLCGVMLDNGEFYGASKIILAAGAMHSPRLLQDYLARSGLANTLPNAALVGRYFKRHILTAVLAFSKPEKTDSLRKTSLWLNKNFPHGSIQPLGFSSDVLAALLPAWVPHGLATRLSRYAYGFFLQTEDASHPDNRVSINVKVGHAPPVLNYDLNRITHGLKEHRRMVKAFRRSLLRAGLVCFSKSIPLSGTAHACGTLITGNDPSSSVVDCNGKVHNMANLYVADGSILPRSSRVNPALTIYAWGLRLADILITINEVNHAKA